MMFSLPVFSAHQRSADMRFLMVPGESSSASQRATSLLDVLGLQAVGVHMPESHLVELVGDQIEDVLPIRLGGIAAIAVVLADLLQVVVQVTHRYLLSLPFVRAR